MNLRRLFVALFALIVMLGIGTSRAKAQTTTTGEVSGVITDPSNAVVPDATVTLQDNAKGTTQDTKTSKDGVYHFYLLSPGSYTVTATATGFKTISRHVTVALGQIADGNVQLSLGSSAMSVTVTEAAPLVQTENGDTSTAISAQQVANVPNPGNDLSAIAQIAPGAVMNTQGGMGNVEAFGLPATANLFTMNGMDDNDPFLNLNNSGASNLLLGSNEIQEADVVTNGYSAGYGTFSGINVNYITKSGGNDFHGNAVYYWNGRALNANDWFSKAFGENRPFVNANQYAASVGGPIKKDKLFFFFNTEGLRVLIPVPSNIQIPTPGFESAVVNNLTALGDTASIPYYCQNLSAICPGVSGVTGSGNGMFNFYNGVANYSNAQDVLTGGAEKIVTGSGSSAVTHNIVTGDGCSNALMPGFFTDTPSTGSPFPGSVATPAACALFLHEVPVNYAPEWLIALRTDWNITQNDRFFVRVQSDRGTQPTATDPVNPLFNAQSWQPEYQGQLSETHTFSPTLTNQFLMASTWYSAIFEPANLAATLNAFPTTLSMGDGSLSNIGGTGYIWPQGRNVTQIQFQDDITKTIGEHTLHFGGKFHKNYVSDHDFGFFNSGLEIPFSLADFANGGDSTNEACPSAATYNGSNANVNCLATVGNELIKSYVQSLNQPVRLWELSGYVMDEWHARSNLTITPGLRIEHASNPDCATNCFAQLGETYGPNMGIEPYNSLISTGRGGALFSYTKVQWEPRLSFAWQPFGSQTGFWKSNLVVRGGAGIFFDVFPGQIADSLAQNSPLFNQFTVASFSPNLTGSAPTCPGYLSPNQTPGSNLNDCAAAANSAFVSAFNSGATALSVLPNIVFTAGPTTIGSESGTKAPEVQKWSLEIQKGLGANDSFDIGYYGNHAIHEPVFDNSLNAFGFGGLPATPASSQFGEMQLVETEGISNYNGVTASFRHRFSGRGGGGELQFNYSYGHALDEVSNGGFNAFDGATLGNPVNPFNLHWNYGNADYDVRHDANANYVWQLPIRQALGGHGWAPLVDGWQVSGTVFFRTGFPFSVLDGTEASLLNADNFFAAFPVAPLTSVPLSCSGEAHVGPSATSCFAAGSFPTPGTETSLSGPGLRNQYRGPDYFDTDFAVSKKTKLPHWERADLQIGFQFFNAFNHPNFTLPVDNTASPVFGTIQGDVAPPTSILGSFLGGDAAPRLIQLKAQLEF
jgi:hypothetical protein